MLRAKRPELPFVPGHDVELLIDGGPFYRRILEAIASAQRYVLVETYIWESDRTGWKVLRALAERAEAGVEVAVCYDGFGSSELSEDFVAFMERAGIKHLAFRPVSFFKGSWPWSRRNHRKLIVVDGRVGFVGGMNLANEYAAPEDGGGGWRDTSACIRGPAIVQLESMFRSLWSTEGGEALSSKAATRTKGSGPMSVRFLANFYRGERPHVRRAYLAAIVKAKARIRICNAYFFPDRGLRRALVRAARRGVLVELIVPATSDVRPAVYASRSLYGRFLRHDIAIYEWHRTVLHAKTAVIDGNWSTVGSSNLDPFSSFVNLEVNVSIRSERFGEIMDRQFELDRAACRRIERAWWKKRPWTQRVVELFFRLVARRY